MAIRRLPFTADYLPFTVCRLPCLFAFVLAFCVSFVSSLLSADNGRRTPVTPASAPTRCNLESIATSPSTSSRCCVGGINSSTPNLPQPRSSPNSHSTLKFTILALPWTVWSTCSPADNDYNRIYDRHDYRTWHLVRQFI